MKKLLVAVALLVASSFVFANDSFLEKWLEDFWYNGQAIKIVENDKVTYVNKSTISTIELDGDTLTIINNTYNTQVKANWTLNISKYGMSYYSSSVNDNLVLELTKK